MSAAREAVLAALRGPRLEAPALPELASSARPGPAGERRARFAAALAAVGGRCVEVPERAALEAALEALPAYTGAARVASAVEGAGRRANVGPAALRDPHGLADLGFALLPGRFGVAENGAVWVTDADVPHRALYWIAEHVALALPGDALVEDLHGAYERLRFEGPGFGAFVSGPSKTADIEQALVIGAHGPRSLTVLLVP